MHTTRVPATPSHERSFLPLLATLAGGVATVTLILIGAGGAPPAFGVIGGGVVMVLFVLAVLVGMQRLLSDA
ncbi:MAG: hypothetical protein H0V81_03750 [Solirubrobacterales bacterium]|nr:hypothetical protein [Solirubrobacterales bacterium]